MSQSAHMMQEKIEQSMQITKPEDQGVAEHIQHILSHDEDPRVAEHKYYTKCQTSGPFYGMQG